jgi:hypothetical protein
MFEIQAMDNMLLEISEVVELEQIHRKYIFMANSTNRGE